jgi:hypothetical protein
MGERVNRIFAMLALVVLVCSACGHGGVDAAASGGKTLTVANPGFEQSADGEDIPGWQFSQHAGPKSFAIGLDGSEPAEGKFSLRMTRTQPQVYGSVTQTLPLKGYVGKTVRVSAKMKSDGVGEKGWKLFMAARGQRTVVYSDAVTGTTPWKDVSVEVKITPEVDQLLVGATLLDAGTGWIDDVQVHVVD